MEEEAEKLKQMQTEVTNEMTSPAGSGSAASLNMSFEEKVQIDGRYVFVNVSGTFTFFTSVQGRADFKGLFFKYNVLKAPQLIFTLPQYY